MLCNSKTWSSSYGLYKIVTQSPLIWSLGAISAFDFKFISPSFKFRLFIHKFYPTFIGILQIFMVYNTKCFIHLARNKEEKKLWSLEDSILRKLLNKIIIFGTPSSSTSFPVITESLSSHIPHVKNSLDSKYNQ